MSGIKTFFLYTCHTLTHKSKEHKCLNFCCLGNRINLLKFVEGCLPKGGVAPLPSFTYYCFMWFEASKVLTTDVFCLLNFLEGNSVTLGSRDSEGSIFVLCFQHPDPRWDRGTNWACPRSPSPALAASVYLLLLLCLQRGSCSWGCLNLFTFFCHAAMKFFASIGISFWGRPNL